MDAGRPKKPKGAGPRAKDARAKAGAQTPAPERPDPGERIAAELSRLAGAVGAAYGWADGRLPADVEPAARAMAEAALAAGPCLLRADGGELVDAHFTYRLRGAAGPFQSYTRAEFAPAFAARRAADRRASAEAAAPRVLAAVAAALAALAAELGPPGGCVATDAAGEVFARMARAGTAPGDAAALAAAALAAAREAPAGPPPRLPAAVARYFGLPR